MVTLPSQPAAGDAAHRHRELAESFGADAARYDRVRPRYPAGMVDSIADRMPGRSIIDVGIGTGISSEPFRARGFTVLGVEPDPQMAALARSKGLDVEDARFEEWDASGRTFDGVIAGQTWHWIDPVAGAAKAAAILRPGGVLALFWNSLRVAATLADAFARAFSSLDTGLPFNPWTVSPHADPYGSIIDAAAVGLRAAAAFGEFERLSFDWQVTVTRDEWLEQTSTSAGINRLPKRQLDALLSRMGAMIDEAGGTVVVDYTTVAALARRLP